MVTGCLSAAGSQGFHAFRSTNLRRQAPKEALFPHVWAVLTMSEKVCLLQSSPDTHTVGLARYVQQIYNILPFVLCLASCGHASGNAEQDRRLSGGFHTSDIDRIPAVRRCSRCYLSCRSRSAASLTGHLAASFNLEQCLMLLHGSISTL